MELLGCTIEDLFNRCNRKFSLKTILMIFDQLITRVEAVHTKGFLHRDIKPDNIAMGLKRNQHKVSLKLGMKFDKALGTLDRLWLREILLAGSENATAYFIQDRKTWTAWFRTICK